MTVSASHSSFESQGHLGFVGWAPLVDDFTYGGGGPKGRSQGGNFIPLAMTLLASRLGSTVA
jgi:hypothetical protein